MKGKKLGKQSQHVRRVPTKRGVKRVMINLGVRKKKVKKPTVKSKLNYNKPFQFARFKEGQSFSSLVSKEGKKYKRIKYGFEPSFFGGSHCGDCGVPKGYYHWLGCDIEISPVPEDKGKQLISSNKITEWSK